MSSKRFITAALPYANGPLHFGHLAGVYLPSDIYFRHSQLSGRDSLFICGSDEHGVAITLNAEKQKMPYRDYVDIWHEDHQELFASYDVSFTEFGRTTSEIHKKYAQEFFLKIHRAGYLKEKSEKQAYCLYDKIFLPDRYLVGECSVCGYADARSDECPNCGTWLSFEQLKNPRCAVCGKSQIEVREVKQWYFDLPRLAPRIREWLESQSDWKLNVKKYALSLLEGIPERAVTRNVSWGVDLPSPFTSDVQKIYVWFEAPVGYFSNLIEHFATSTTPDLWKEYWNLPSEMIHFIGKDNIIFHTIIWPAMLLAAGERLPTNVPANMFVNLQKRQFSKSSGWYVDAKEAVSSYGVDCLRYYLISLIPEFQDTNFDWQIFLNKVNSELVNKIANLFNRVGSQIKKHYQGVLLPEDFESISSLEHVHSEVLQFIEKFDLNAALSRIVVLSEEANKYLDEAKPWNLVREDPLKARRPFAVASNYMLSVAALLQPFLPTYSSRVLKAFSIQDDQALRSEIYRKSAFRRLREQGLKISSESDFVILRIDSKKIEAEIAKLGQLKT